MRLALMVPILIATHKVSIRAGLGTSLEYCKETSAVTELILHLETCKLARSIWLSPIPKSKLRSYKTPLSKSINQECSEPLFSPEKILWEILLRRLCDSTS